MALEHKDMSEHEILLSDVNDFIDDPQDSIARKQANEADDPLVKAAIAQHHDLKQEKKNNIDEAAFQLLERNAFCIPSTNKHISCGISWRFLDENKLIDLDLVVTALDIYSFEMDSVNKDHKKMFKKSIIYNKNKAKNMHNKDNKLINFKLDSIPENCHSLWFIIDAYNGDSLKDVDKAIFNMYAGDDCHGDVLYSYDMGMGFDCGAILLGILYRNNNGQSWKWTIVEEKNLKNNLIKNNLNLIYDDVIIAQRPNDKNIFYELKQCHQQYIIDLNVNKLEIGIGWDLSTNIGDNMQVNDKQKEKLRPFDIDIDVDGSVMVFGAIEKEENAQGIEEESCRQIDIVNNNNNFYKTYVQYIKNERELINVNNNEDAMDDELGVIDVDVDAVDDEEMFDIYLAKMNADNDIGSLCILLNIFNDNNLQNKNKTNNITGCYVRLIDVKNNKKELCRYKLANVNSDKKTVCLVLAYMKRLENGCWCLYTNDVPLKTNSSLEFQQYAKQIVLGKYSQKNNAHKDACCVIL